MASDVNKHLERAKKFLEKNRVEDAIEAYLAVLDEAPLHAEASQALGDLYTRVDQPDRAAVYYGHLFDLLVEPRDETKALAIYNRFLRHSPRRSRPNALRVTPSCSRSKTGRKKPSSNTAKPRNSSAKRAGARTRCFAGSAPRNSIRTI